MMHLLRRVDLWDGDGAAATRLCLLRLAAKVSRWTCYIAADGSEFSIFRHPYAPPSAHDLLTLFPRPCVGDSAWQPRARSFSEEIDVGGVVEMAEHPPAMPSFAEIAKVMECAPALAPKLIELAQWIANYYLAPIGEVFRAILLPVSELNLRREIVLTTAGRRG